ncbi:hypothetical protein Sgou_31980 [Streptomyces gougerotii]|uniref:Uncharacterized protein n=1 Tax=Streptomyces gougerotii TaxID=53448 RepID=A0A8H9LSC6_9ACTN|nr:hypothetical protein Sgou_31980 [Streptomyces gougerotii]GGU91317.1 hypothetical protein GCM10010227_53190 [Streptomyces gougerotii]
MANRRARTYAVCAVKLDEDHTDAAEGTFDAALTNALVAIVAKEWDGEEKKGGRKGKTFTKPASELLELIRQKAHETPEVVKRVLDEPDVFLVRGSHAEERDLAVEEHPAAEASVAGTFSGSPAPKPYGTRVDVGTLLDALKVTQPVRHAREDKDETEGEPRALERRHVEALLALDAHPSLVALAMEQENRYENSAQQQDAREREQASQTLQRIGEEEADRRAAAAADLHSGPTPDDPGALELQECPVCWHEAFSPDGQDELCMQVGHGECLVCHYRRSPAIANALAREREWERGWARD